jgi:hypothetical protein
MNMLRSALVAAALFVASQAQASVTSVSFKGTLDYRTQGLEEIYGDGLAFTGQLTIDDHAAPVGRIDIGGNTISFWNSEATVQDGGYNTVLFVESGRYWGTEGGIQETWAKGISGMHLHFEFAPGIPFGTPLSQVLAMQPVGSPSLSLQYGRFDSASGAIDEIAPLAQVPEPAGVLLMSLGLGVIVAGRRVRRSPGH